VRQPAQHLHLLPQPRLPPPLLRARPHPSHPAARAHDARADEAAVGAPAVRRRLARPAAAAAQAAALLSVPPAFPARRVPVPRLQESIL
jgi:hypothetical protein